MAVFLLNSFCSKVPADLLNEVFERFGIDNVNLKELKSEQWEEEWQRVTESYDCAPRVIALFQQVNEFKSEKAHAALQDAAEFFLPSTRFEEFREECLALKNIQSCLLKAWLINEEIFEYACNLYIIDSIARSGWKQRTGVGHYEVDTSAAALHRLSEEIRNILGKQMRGRFCKTTSIGQRGDNHLILAQISDYNETSDEFLEGELKERPRLPSRPLVFIYNAGKGTLNISTQGFGRVGESFHAAFCRTVLGLPGLPKQKQRPVYCLSQLLLSPPDFYVPHGAVKSCAVVGMQVKDRRLGKMATITLTAPNNQNGDATRAIYEQLNMLFGDALQKHVELRSVTLQMRLQLRYSNEMNKKIRLSEIGTQNFDFGEADEDIHAFLGVHGLEMSQDLEGEA